jgi:Nitroreductase family
MAVIAAGETTRELMSLLQTRRPGRNSSAAAGDFGGGLGTLLETPLEVVLRRRGAVREFSAAELPVGQVEDLVARGFVAERQVWRAGAHGDPGFAVLVAARRVAGLAEGVYAATLQRPALARLQVPAPLAPVRQAYGDAPAFLLICADPHQQRTGAGGCSYGSLLVRAGTLGYAMWLAAISSGLAGCAYGGGCHDATLFARHLNPRFRHLFTVAIGMGV